MGRVRAGYTSTFKLQVVRYAQEHKKALKQQENISLEAAIHKYHGREREEKKLHLPAYRTRGILSPFPIHELLGAGTRKSGN
jgi:hypothetical protein